MSTLFPRLRDRLRGRTHSDPRAGDGTIATGNESRYAPTLDDFAEMQLVIGSNFNTGYELIDSMYDHRHHRYRPEYIHDTTPTLYLSSQPGLARYESTLLPGNP